MDAYILAIDEGTTSTRAVLFDSAGNPVRQAQRDLRQHYPRPGWVEHDPEEIWASTVDVIRQASGDDAVAAIGITNQRETTVLWERATGRPVHNAIVWQDRRTSEACERVVEVGHEPLIQQRTGLVVDPYFSASKIAWLLDHEPGLRERAERGEVLFGTVDSYLLWKLTAGKVHATDATNAARTMLFNIHTQQWDEDLLEIWGVPRAMLPEVRDSDATFGETNPEAIGIAAPITGIAGDQHAAVIGQACFEPGMMKCTYGTGAFLLLNTGREAVTSSNRLLTTVAYRLKGETTYALEGSIFNAGTTVQWLRDELGLIRDAAETAELARTVPPEDGEVYLVPAFTGLGAPYWDAGARAAITGITRGTTRAAIARAALQAVAYQTRDVLEAMVADGAPPAKELRVDGGMVANDWLAQAIADAVNLPVRRPPWLETTARGAAALAALGAGIHLDTSDLAATWREDSAFHPATPDADRDVRYRGWLDAVRRVRTTGE